MRSIFILLCAISLQPSLFALNKTEAEKFGISFNGYICYSGFYDTRQTVASREGYLVLYPAPKAPDKNGEDANAQSSMNMFAVQTRLAGKISAPEFLGAKTSGMFEAEFVGHSDPDINGFRLRHAYISLTWDHISLMIGQYWNPMFLPEVVVGAVASNAGAPFVPFARNPQIRLTATFDNVKLVAALLSQRDFASYGPSGSSSVYLRNSAIPDMHLQIQYLFGKNIIGCGGEFKMLQPRLATDLNYKTTQKVSSYTVNGFMKLYLDPATFKMEATYGGNMGDATMLGGYAVKSFNSVTHAEEYTPTKTVAIWADISTGKELEFGLFTGYAKNLGAGQEVTSTFYGRGGNIDNVFRIAPRMQYTEGSTKFTFEPEYTSASYGTADNKWKVKDTYSVGNLRLLFTMFYYF
jgi:hypothetical protein